MKIGILGGGLAGGLSLGYFLNQRGGYDFLILEKNPETGGGSLSLFKLKGSRLTLAAPT